MKKFRTKKAVIAISTLTLIFAGRTQLAQAASTTADAVQVVIASLAIAKVSDLDFGSAPQGDATKTVAPGVAEDASNASFTVSGQPSTAYTITLPADGVVTMTTAGGGAANKIINVNGFASFPSAASAGSGLLDVGGTQLLLVGAARDALLAGQTTGSYTGAFTVSVVY